MYWDPFGFYLLVGSGFHSNNTLWLQIAATMVVVFATALRYWASEIDISMG